MYKHSTKDGHSFPECTKAMKRKVTGRWRCGNTFQGHFLSTHCFPPSSYSCLEIHICWKVPFKTERNILSLFSQLLICEELLKHPPKYYSIPLVSALLQNTHKHDLRLERILNLLYQLHCHADKKRLRKESGGFGYDDLVPI